MTGYKIAIHGMLLALLSIHDVSNAFLSVQNRMSALVSPRLGVKPQLEEPFDIKLLLIDHYDSFTYNLANLLSQYCTQPPDVVLADDLLLLSRSYDGIVLSPGPGHPRDYPVSLHLVQRHPHMPILGVCLGHQILGLAHNADIVQAPEPVHGQIHSINTIDTNENDPLWGNIIDDDKANPIVATRYHSLAVDLSSSRANTTAQSVLIPTAFTRDDGVLMGLRHATFPHHGLQFHPESIGTIELGHKLIRNYCQLVHEHKTKKTIATTASVGYLQTSEKKRRIVQRPSAVTPPPQPTTCMTQPPYTVYVHKVPHLPPNGDNPTTAQVFDMFMKDTEYSFWLDRESRKHNAFSIMGTGRKRIEYWQDDGKHGGGDVHVVTNDNGTKVYASTDILSYLDAQPNAETVVLLGGSEKLHVLQNVSSHALPFDFVGGHVGYLAYEVRHDTSPQKETSKGSNKTRTSEQPTAAFLWAERSFVFDHVNCEWYLVGLAENDKEKDQLFEWIASVSSTLQKGLPSHQAKLPPYLSPLTPPTFHFRRSQETYSRNFASCMDHIYKGDSYELCLTNQIETTAPRSLSSLHLYHILRRRNPAPHAAYLAWGSQWAVCCSSPERFVSVRNKNGNTTLVEAQPIKGTARRILNDQVSDQLAAEQLQSNPKDRAENLMIVDLLRNDLHRVCDQVHVPRCMELESFATVHQLVSTIQGTLQSQKTAVDVLRASFPGGSMTGAPKLRSTEILEELEEGEPRGVFSGCLGYMSCNGSMDMNIVIRTAVLTATDHDEWRVRIGAGGAITVLSNDEDEYDEMLLKGSAVMGAVKEWIVGRNDSQGRQRIEGLPRPISNATVPSVL